MEHALTPLPQTIWEGPVGVAFHVRRDGRTGDHYLTFEPVRRARNDANGVWSYPHDFSERHAQALGVVIGKALRLISETDPKLWVASRGQQNAA